MSKSFYKSKHTHLPKLITYIENNTKRIEIWNTTCIVTNFGKNQEQSNFNVLINSGNDQLSGTSNFPYFPRGGPVPKHKPKDMHRDWQPLGYVSNWGGMEVGLGMLYPVSVVDGLVHQLGGNMLRMECKMIQAFQGGCPIGKSVITSYGDSELKKCYDYIIHTTLPFYKHDDDPLFNIRQCYKNSLKLLGDESRRRSSNSSTSSTTDPRIKVACPLLGAGAKGFPLDIAIQVAIEESFEWFQNEEQEKVVVPSSQQQLIEKNTSTSTSSSSYDMNKNCSLVLGFGIPELKVAETMADMLNVTASSQ